LICDPFSEKLKVPERVHRIAMNENSVTTDDIKPSDKVKVRSQNNARSSAIRWSDYRYHGQ
jgi:hypothetical protein